jgi:phosphatidylglycerophosphate synthase
VKRISGLVFDAASPVTIGGLTLTERAVLMAHRAGLSPVRVTGIRPLDSTFDARLRSRGVSAVQLPPGAPPLGAVGDDEDVVAIGANVLFDLATLTDLAGRARRVGGAAVVRDGSVSLLLVLSPDAASRVAACRSVEEMATSLAAEKRVREWSVPGAFCRRIDSGASAARVEREFIRHLNGSESFFTKIIRRLSVPFTSRLVRLGAGPTHVTIGGLILAIASAWFIAQGTYAAGLLGAALSYTSMVFDCSDGEVARLTVRDSPFGAWLETIVDYVTYFLLLAAVTAASADRPGADTYRAAAGIALVGSVVFIAIAGYLRHRVAAADPGQFDDASATAMASSTAFHRFATWARQWIKRSSVAHLVVALALINQLPVLLYLWAFGATVASVVMLAVEPFVVRRVAVVSASVHDVDAGD